MCVGRMGRVFAKRKQPVGRLREDSKHDISYKLGQEHSRQGKETGQQPAFKISMRGSGDFRDISKEVGEKQTTFRDI